MKPCKHAHWEIVDAEWNHEMICDLCNHRYCDILEEKCPDYEEKDND